MSLNLRQTLGRKLTIQEMDYNLTYLNDKKDISRTSGTKKDIIENNSEIYFSENIFGTAIDGSQMISINDESEYSFALNMVGVDPQDKPVSLSMIVGTYGSSTCVQTYDLNHDRWRSQLGSECFYHNVNVFVATEADSDPELTRSEIETFDVFTQEKSNIKVYKKSIEIASYLAGGTNSTSISVENNGNFKINSEIITVNNQPTYSGTYSTMDNKVVTVINGLITSIE